MQITAKKDLISAITAVGLGALLWGGVGHEPARADTPSQAAAPQQDPAELSLSEEHREYLWELEHRGNVLTKYGFKPLANALQQRDLSGLEMRIAEDFEGAVPEAGRTVTLDAAGVYADRHEAAADQRRSVDRSGFIDWLLEQRDRFNSEFHAKLKISRYGPIEKGNIQGAWQGLIRLRIWGEAQDGRPAASVIWLVLRTAEPTKQRLAEPGWLIGCDVKQAGFSQAQNFLFEDVAAQRGLDPDRFYDNWTEQQQHSATGSLLACDYNRDGWTDLLVTDIASPGVVLYEGQTDGSFLDVTREAGLLSESATSAAGLTSATCAFVDVDNDGWEDLIASTGVIYLNRRGERFEFAGDRSNLALLLHSPATSPRPAVGLIPGDYDRDGLIDLYVIRTARGPDPNASWIETETSPNSGNQLLRNLGGLHFEDVTRASGAEAGGRSTFSAVWLDANNDRWPDIYAINEFGKGLLLVNQADGTFAEHDIADDLGDFGSMGLACGDINNDDRIDIYSANMYSKAGNRIMDNMPDGLYSDTVMTKLRRLVAGSRLYRNTGDLSFDRVDHDYQVYDIGWAWGPALADLNNDGWQDLYATCGYISRDRAKPDG